MRLWDVSLALSFAALVWYSIVHSPVAYIAPLAILLGEIVWVGEVGADCYWYFYIMSGGSEDGDGVFDILLWIRTHTCECEGVGAMLTTIVVDFWTGGELEI